MVPNGHAKNLKKIYIEFCSVDPNISKHIHFNSMKIYFTSFAICRDDRICFRVFPSKYKIKGKLKGELKIIKHRAPGMLKLIYPVMPLSASS